MGEPCTDTSLGVKLLSEITNLLHMWIVRTTSTFCLDQEMQIAQLAADNNIADCKPMLTPIVVHTGLQRTNDILQACIPFMHLVGFQL